MVNSSFSSLFRVFIFLKVTFDRNFFWDSIGQSIRRILLKKKFWGVNHEKSYTPVPLSPRVEGVVTN